MLQIQQQSDDLDRFAQAHVVGQTSSQAEPAQKSQPRDPRPLIRSQLGHEPRRLGGIIFLQTAQFLKRLFKRWPRCDSRPLRCGRFGHRHVTRQAHPGQQPHALEKAEASMPGIALHLLPMLQRFA